MKPLLKRLFRALQREDGTATIEFVLIIPALLMVFMASFESGLLMTRQAMLERALDMTMRELRLGHFIAPTHDLLKAEICSRTVILSDCENVIKIELQPISTTTWALPSAEVPCVDRAEPLNPVTTTFTASTAQDIMLVRVCVVADALFPMTGFGLHLPKDALGGYRLLAQSAFVNEPS